MVYFLLYLFLELMITINISSAIGGFATFLEIIVSAFIGIVILINFKNTLFENMSKLSRNQINVGEFERLNLFTILGAFLLILPGFLTDIVGLLLQFGAVSSMVVNRYSVKFSTKEEKFEKNYREKESDVIDVEIISDNSYIK
ncbi:FxsA family protein [Sulfurimonas sp.]|uniref:FxsA family protein n=1 Tax=Sulfurimonas sp. TaxID=2022749 RepID=UPI0025F98186|nr:FxsA family protein [Sulfurimonas sp.]MDD5156779.1 FxsA family protein [Sulfurimonas sp.]